MKKLLLILLIPMIGFGQSESLDTLVFSDGKKVNAIIIEVGIDEVKYRFKNENNTNIIQTNKLAKIIFSSGRTQIFKGNQKLKFKKEREIRQKVKKQKRKKERESFKSSFEIGAIFGGSLNNNTIDMGDVKTIGSGPDNQKKHITTIQGLIVKYNYSPHFSINTQLNYHITGWNRNLVPIETSFVFDGTVLLEDHCEINATNHYLSLPITFEYNFHNKPNFIVKTGFYSAYLTNHKLDDINGSFGIIRNNLSASHTTSFSNMSNLFSDNLLFDSNIDYLKYVNRFDFGGILGIGLSYPINDQLTALFDCSAYFGVTDFYTDEVWEGFGNWKRSEKRTYTAILGLTYNLDKTID